MQVAVAAVGAVAAQQSPTAVDVCYVRFHDVCITMVFFWRLQGGCTPHRLATHKQPGRALWFASPWASASRPLAKALALRITPKLHLDATSTYCVVRILCARSFSLWPTWQAASKQASSPPPCDSVILLLLLFLRYPAIFHCDDDCKDAPVVALRSCVGLLAPRWCGAASSAVEETHTPCNISSMLAVQ